MARPHPIDVLNRLLVIHSRSLPVYLGDAAPWTHQGDEEASQTLAQIIDAHRAMVDRIGETILEREGDVDRGEFPLLYADWHDLSLDFLLTRLVAVQRADVTAIARCVEDLTGDPMAKALAEEALGEAKGHLESLEELVEQPSGTES